MTSRVTKPKVKTSLTPVLSEVVEDHEIEAGLGQEQARVDLVGHKEWTHQTGSKEVLRRAHGFWKKIGPKVKNRSTEGKQRAAVEGISRLSAAEGAVRLPRDRRDTREIRGARRRRQSVRERSCGDDV